MERIENVLAEAGHEVVNFQPFFRESGHTGVLHKSIRTINYTFKEGPLTNQQMGNRGGPARFLEGGFKWKELFVSPVQPMGRRYREFCIEMVTDDEFMDKLAAENFDLLIFEFFTAAGAVIGERLGIKKRIMVSSMPLQFELAKLLGIPSTPSFVPDGIHTENVKGFIGRLKSCVGVIRTTNFIRGLTYSQGEALKAVRTNKSFKEILATCSYFWVNTDEFVDFPRPISHKYINIGGLGMADNLKKATKLPDEIENVFKKAKKGVILASFGTVTKTAELPESYKKGILNAFAEFPEVEFIWKYEESADGLPVPLPSNVYLSDWLPQRDILLHPKTLGFITHGGMNSISEATWSGVPTIVVPLFADQHRNGAMAKRKKVGEVLSKLDLAKTDVIVEKIGKLVNDESYKENAQKLAQIIRNKPISPEQRVVQTAEFAARYDIEEHLDMDGRKLSTIEYYNIDIILVAVAVPAAFVWLTSYLLF
ncbi:unnamed protein product [Bursaphelenchus xylophilus]|nr:unnamed protein product [Bursaphelenchus xylophilus]CAG9094041.1 unnamed protein product [Bursaphelenchus xylophilus]